MTAAPRVVFLFDVDNTLVDNDRVQAHLKEHLAQTYGAATRDRYWDILEELRRRARIRRLPGRIGALPG